MKILKEINAANSLLKHYQGASFQIYLFDTSLWRLAIQLRIPQQPEVLYVVGVGCQHITGNFYYHNAYLEIIQLPETAQTIIADKQAGFTLVTTGGLALAQGLDSEFGDSFDNFLPAAYPAP
jgi:hypothetical protein